MDVITATTAQDRIGPAQDRLRRSKRGATGLLAVVAVLYLLTYLSDGDGGWVGFARAATEAGMIGGLADWFAVTALFRHPMGLPIPHTALVPTRKDALAASLGGFITGHFLTRDVMRTQLAKADLVRRMGSWLAVPDNARTLSREAASAASALLEAVDEVALTDAVLELARRDAARRPYAPLLGKLLDDLMDKGSHRPVFDALLRRARIWIQENRDALTPHIQRTLETSSLLARLVATEGRIHRLLDAVVRLVREVEVQPEHDLRHTAERLLRGLASDLSSGEQTARDLDAMIDRFLDEPRTREWIQDALGGVLTSLRAVLADPDSDLVRRVGGTVEDLGRRAVDDPEFHARLENWLEQGVLHMVDRYAEEFTRLVQDTVARWDGDDTALRIETAVGRDLQFIRINGTVVGALAGVAIHAVSLLL